MLVKRQNWRSVKNDIASLTVEQLQAAAKTVANRQPIGNPTIRGLQRDLTTIGMQVPEAFSQKLLMRSEIKGFIIRGGEPGIWATLNPSDLKNPLVLILAGIEIPIDALPAASAAIRNKTATSNPVAVAQLFNHTCKAILDGLIQSGKGKIGIFGQVANHYGVVETNGRGMLHLHILIWLTGNHAFSTLRERLLQDEDFAQRMIQYLESIIVESINSYNDSTLESESTNAAPSSKHANSDIEFHQKLMADSNAVARKTQIHASNHMSTCFKYGQKKTKCRFDFPRDLQLYSNVDELGVIHLARNHAWVNSWNPAIASCIRSNHDISWIPTKAKYLALMYYITNYMTKDDISPYQIIMKAALLKQSIDKAKATQTPDATDMRLRNINMDHFALHCFNTLCHDREISGVQIANSLLQLPTHYTTNYNFVRINLWWLRQYVRMAIESMGSLFNNFSESIAEEQCTFQVKDAAPVSNFDNYKWRDSNLAHLTFFEYCMLVEIKRMADATASDVEFNPNHPRCNTHVQHIVRIKSQVKTVCLNGQLSQYQTQEESVQGGHPNTAAIKNDLAEVRLGFFLPWDKLSTLFQQHASEYDTKRDACSKIWDIVEPTLSPHNRYFARNMELLRKSKEDGMVDAALRKETAVFQNDLDSDIDDVEVGNFDVDTEEPQSFLQEEVTTETLISAYHSIATSWRKELLAASKHIPSLSSRTNAIQHLQSRSLVPLDIFQVPTFATSGIRFFPNATLETWKSQIKIFTRHDQLDDVETDERIAFEDNDFTLDLGDGTLHPTLNSLQIQDMPNLADLRSRLGNNPSGTTLTALVSEVLPLNAKQRLVVNRVLSAAIAWKDHPYDASKRDLMLLYVGGEGGTGKSQVIKAIVTGMNLMDQKQEVNLMAPTGAAADNIGGNTYHTALGISICKTQKPTVSDRVKKLWSNKTIMVMDEVSMLDLTSLNMINNQCKIAKSLDRSSPDLFGGLPIVIFMGDFFQFSPVKGQSLWKKPRNRNDEDTIGQMIWYRFKEVIILNEQMRQAQDPEFRELVGRARTSTLTEEDLVLLNTKVITSLFMPELEDATFIVKLNALRHRINLTRMEHFARCRSQRIYIFPAKHSRATSASSSSLNLEDLLEQRDKGTKIPFQGLFFYTQGMPAVILANICTLLGHVNGTHGIPSSIVVDPSGMLFHD